MARAFLPLALIALFALTPQALGTQASAPPAATGRLGFDDDYVSHPEVADRAAALGHDPERIFAFVRDEISFECYQGVLRGALGTLWSRAGNAADQAVLLHALLRESGVDARFARGTLSPVDGAALVRSMFAGEPRRGDAAPSGETAGPPVDPALLDEVRGHVWLQMRRQDGWVDLDPSMADGRSRARRGAIFDRLPEDLYHRLRLRLRLEREGPQGLQETYPLAYEGRTADLVGQRMVFGHQPEQLRGQVGIEAAQLGRVLAARRLRYLPLLTVGASAEEGEPFAVGGGPDPGSPLTQIAEALGGTEREAGEVTGEWLEFTLVYPGGREEAFERELFDRLGPAARRRGEVDRPPSGDPEDLVRGTLLSILVAPGRVPRAVVSARIRAALEPLIEEHDRLVERMAEREQAGEAALRDFVTRSLLPFDARLTVEETHLLSWIMAAASDDLTAEIAAALEVKSYYDSPRVLIAEALESEEGAVGFSVDLRRDSIRALPLPGGDALSGVVFRGARGLLEAALEGAVVEAVTGRPAVSAPVLIGQAEALGTEMVALSPADVGRLDRLSLPGDSKARIARSLEAGYGIVVPTRFAASEGRDEPRGAWWRVDPTEGEVVGVLSSGLHQALTEYELQQVALVHDFLVKGKKPLDYLIGFDLGLIAYGGEMLRAADSSAPWTRVRASACRAAPTSARILAMISSLGNASRYRNLSKAAKAAVKAACR